jgi:hypothetical protein
LSDIFDTIDVAVEEQAQAAQEDVFDQIDIFDQIDAGAVSVDPTIQPTPVTPLTPPVVVSEPIVEEPEITPARPVRQPREFRGFFSELGTALARGAARTGAAGLQFVERLSTPGSIFEPGTFENLAEPLQDFAESAKVQPATVAKDAPTRDKVKAFVANAVGETIPFMAAATASVLATGTPLAAFGTSFAVEGESARQEALAAGASEDQADIEAFVVGTINGALEKLQIDEVLSFAGVGRGSLRSLINAVKEKSLKKIAAAGGRLTLETAKTSISEGLQEALQETTSLFAPGITGREIPPGGLRRVGMAALGGAVAGPILGGAAGIVQEITPTAVEGEEVITQVKEKPDGRQRDEERREEFRVRRGPVEGVQRAEEAKALVEARERVVLEEGRQGLEERAAEVAPLFTAEPKVEGIEFFRGEGQNIGKGPDMFFSGSKDVAGDFGEVRAITEVEIPKNPLRIGSKEELAEIIGFKGDPRAEKLNAKHKFDDAAKAYAISQGNDAILYEQGTFDEPELHIFDKKPPTPTAEVKKKIIPAQVPVAPLSEEQVVKEQIKTPDTTVTAQTPVIRKNVIDAVEFDPERPTTSARQAQIDEDRENLGLKEINSPSRRAFQKAQRKAIEQKIPERAMAIADEINTAPRPLSDIETAGMSMKLAEMKKTFNVLSREIEAEKDSAILQSKAVQADRVLQEIDVLTQAIRSTGSEKGRALASQKLTIDEDLNLANVLIRAKIAKRADLTVQERKVFTAKISQLEQRIAAIETARTDEASIIAKGQLRRGTRRFTGLTKVQRQAANKSLGQDVKSLLEQGCNN